MRTREEIINDINKQKKIIDSASNEIISLTTELSKMDDENYDWISVHKGAMFLDVSVNMIYRKIQDGTLNTKKIGGKIFIRKSELKSIDDGVA